MKFESLMKSQFLVLFSFLFFLIFTIDFLYVNSTISLFLGILFLFFIPGWLIAKDFSILERIALSPIISVSISILLAFLLNIFLKFPIDKLFLLYVFFASFAIASAHHFFKKTTTQQKSDFVKKEIIILILLFAFVIGSRLLIVLKIDTLIGTDISRYATVAHVMYLKQNIVTDLRPLDVAENFFYFPVSFVLPLLTEQLGLDSIHSITYYSFLFNILSSLVFFLFVNQLFGKKFAFYATFFYAIFYDVSFEYLMGRGVFSFAISFFPLFLSLYFIQKIYDQKNGKLGLLFSLIFLFLTHWYHLFVIVAFIFALLLNEYVSSKRIKLTINALYNILKIIPFLVLFLSPYLISFLPNYFATQKTWKFADWKIYEIGLEKLSPFEKISSMIFVSFATPIKAIIFSLGFLVAILTSFTLIKEKRYLIVFFFIFLLVPSYFYIPSITWKRLVDNTRITYPIFFSITFDNPVFVGISLLSSPFVENNPIWYYFSFPGKTSYEIQQFFDVVGEDEKNAFDFIKTNTPQNATFILDGGGAGCVGGQAGSHGDRIFPLTSRKVFYYTNFCPGLFDLEGYQEKVDLYRSFAIDPNDKEILTKLKIEGVTHVYLGPTKVALTPEIFSNSENFKLIFNKGDVYIFEIL